MQSVHLCRDKQLHTLYSREICECQLTTFDCGGAALHIAAPPPHGHISMESWGREREGGVRTLPWHPLFLSRLTVSTGPSP